MDNKYFVMLHTHSGKLLVPLMAPGGDLGMFNTIRQAEEAAASSVLGAHFGWEVFMQGENKSSEGSDMD